MFLLDLRLDFASVKLPALFLSLPQGESPKSNLTLKLLTVLLVI